VVQRGALWLAHVARGRWVVDIVLDVMSDPVWIPWNERFSRSVRSVLLTRVLLRFRMERFMWGGVLVIGVELSCIACQLGWTCKGLLVVRGGWHYFVNQKRSCSILMIASSPSFWHVTWCEGMIWLCCRHHWWCEICCSILSWCY
jgi:hypothetical protein